MFIVGEGNALLISAADGGPFQKLVVTLSPVEIVVADMQPKMELPAELGIRN
jgi:hypothetical protein